VELNTLIKNLPLLFTALFVSVLFVQSGLDKIFDWKGNLGWLKGHFSETFLAGMVPMMLGVITVMERATGALAAVGLVVLCVSGPQQILSISSIACGAVNPNPGASCTNSVSASVDPACVCEVSVGGERMRNERASRWP